MDQYIERVGGPLPALRRIIETDVGDLLGGSLPHINARPEPEQDGVLEAVVVTLNEFFNSVEYALLQAYYALVDERTQRQYVTECQHTVLQLLGHLLKYTPARQLFTELPPANFTEACCQHIYRGLHSVLEYTVEMADGQVDTKLRLPLAARTLFAELVADDVATLRQHLEAVHVSPALIDITLAPFEALQRSPNATFYQVHYLRALKEALLLPPLSGHAATGDGRVLWTLVAQNFNAPEFIAWFEHVFETRRGELSRYKTRLMSAACARSLAWKPQHPGVREQLAPWLLEQLAAPVNTIDSPHLATSLNSSRPLEEDAPNGEDEPTEDSPYAPDDLTLRNVTPQVFAVVANAARKLHYVFWGRDGKHIAEMVARISSIHRPLSDRTVRRGLTDLATLHKARDILQSLVHFFDRQIKYQEEKISR